MTRKEYKKLFDRDRLSDYLPYIAYDPEIGAFLCIEAGEKMPIHRMLKRRIMTSPDTAPYSVGFIWECCPRVFGGPQTSNAIRLMLEMQDKIMFQFIIFADWFTEPIAYNMLKLNRVPDEHILSVWSKSYIHYIISKKYSGFAQNVPIPARNYRLFVTVKVPCNDYVSEKKKIASIKKSIESTLFSNNFHPQSLDAEIFINLLYRLFNPMHPNVWLSYNENEEIRKQIIAYDTVIERRLSDLLVDNMVVKTFSVKSFPSMVMPNIIQELTASHSTNALEQIPVPFMCVYTVYTDKSIAKSVRFKASMVLAQQGLTTVAYKLAKKKEEFDYTLKHLEDGVQLCKAMMTLVCYIPNDEEKVVTIFNSIKSQWSGKNFVLQDDPFVTLPLWLSSLPLGCSFSSFKYLMRATTTFTDAAGCVAPVQSCWTGTPTPTAVLLSRQGQILTIDIFDSNTNFNAIVAATSGAGKSFFINFLITSYLRTGAQIWVVDVGRSYLKICDVFKGNFIVFSPDSDMCLNPFTHITSKEALNDAMDQLAALFMQMMHPMGKPINEDLEYKQIKRAIQRSYDKYGSDTTVTRIVEELSLMAEEMSQDPKERKTTELISMMKHLLYSYTKDGEAGKWFEGRANVDISGSQFVVLELEELKQLKSLQDVVLLLILFQISQRMYLGDRSVKKIVIIDEAWDLFSGENTAKFLEHTYRRARKYGGAGITITQSIKDFYTNKSIEACAANSNMWFLLKQSPEDIDQVVKQGYLSLSPGIVELLKTIHTNKGLYSEIFIRRIDTQEFGIARLFPDPFSYYMFTTDSRDITVVQKLQKKFQLPYAKLLETLTKVVTYVAEKENVDLFVAIDRLREMPDEELFEIFKKQQSL